VSGTYGVGAVVSVIDLDNVNLPKYLGDFTVDGSGNITLLTAVASILVGYNFDIEIRTLPVDITLADGPYTGRWKRIASVILFLDKTYSVSVSNNVLSVNSAGGNSTELELFLLGYSRSPYITITQSQPEPFRLLGVALEVGI
jgi:hypothetical protein